MISEAKLREIEAWYASLTEGTEQHWLIARKADIPALTKALREAAEIIEKGHGHYLFDPTCSVCQWLREWRGDSEKQGEA